MGIETNLTPEQRDILLQVREAVSDLITPEQDDEFILRFIIARKYDVDSSIQMLKRHLVYWKKNNIAEALRNYNVEKKSLHFLTTPLGFDKTGSLVRLIKVGDSDLRGMVMSHTPHEACVLTYHLLLEDIKSQKERRDTHGDGQDCKMSYILDLHGLPWSCLVSRQLISYFLLLLRAYEANFPEYLKMAYIVNAPSFFGIILNFAKNILPSEIFGKILVVSDPKLHLNAAIDESILPASLGGTITSPEGDPSCPHLFAIPPGTLVPEEYYLATNNVGLNGDEDAKKTVVLNQSSFSLELEVKEPNRSIIWDFETLDNDIGMGLRFKSDAADEEYKVLLPIRRVNSHRFTESGRYDCQECGIYEVLFDNTYSWWARKELTYKVAVVVNEETSKEIS